MPTEIEKMCTAFSKIADLALILQAQPMNQYPNCWEYQVDEHWWIAVNGHKTTKKTTGGIDVLPFNCYVEFNGWPAGVFDPVNGGLMAAGSQANENSFIQALENKIKQCKET